MSHRMLNGKQIVLGITGGIAAYKSAELIRQLTKSSAQVHVIMTRSAREFITPLTLQTLSGNPVTTGLFEIYQEQEIGHISLAQRAQILVIAPATANTIGKIAHGIADDILSTVVMATKAPVLIAPAMNVAMWENPIVQNNIRSLKDHGYHFIDPGWGDLACGVQGTGRMADIEDIVDAIACILSPKDFSGKKILVTAGPTREMIDPVRFISNPSTGKMGFAIAQAFKQRGAEVTLISGPTDLAPPRSVQFLSVHSAEEMRNAVTRCFSQSSIIVKAAAVADYRPKNVSRQKIKKSDEGLQMELEKTDDILTELGKKKGRRILIGFAAETHHVSSYAAEKLKKKNLDMIVANDVSKQGIGFGADVNKVQLIFSDGRTEKLPTLSKEKLAHIILDRIREVQKARSLT